MRPQRLEISPEASEALTEAIFKAYDLGYQRGKAEMIDFFTGRTVNAGSAEMEGWDEFFAELGVVRPDRGDDPGHLRDPARRDPG